MNDNKKNLIAEYLKNKYSDEARQKIVDANAEDRAGLNWTAGLAGLGAALQGKDAVSSGQRILETQEKQRQQKLSDFDTQKQQTIRDYLLQKQEDRAEQGFQLKQQDIELKREANKIEKDKKASQDSRNFTMSLRKEYNSNPIVKDTLNVQQAYGKIKKSADTSLNSKNDDEKAAADMSMIFNYMKMLDPGSTVREGEYANVEQARGVPEEIVARYNKVVSGEKLTDSQRQAYLKQANGIYDSQVSQLNAVNERYSDLSNQFGVDSKNVIMNPYKFEDKPVAVNKELQGTVTVSNGIETFQIPINDLEDAQKDGFKVVK